MKPNEYEEIKQNIHLMSHHTRTILITATLSTDLLKQKAGLTCHQLPQAALMLNFPLISHCIQIDS